MAIVLSALCAVHCAVTPLLLLGLPLIATHDFERGMRLFLALVGLLAVGIGTLLHRTWRAALLLGAGLAVIAWLEITQLHGPEEVVLSLLAAALMVGAHVYNTIACRSHTSPA
jgi:hypothetical protein